MRLHPSISPNIEADGGVLIRNGSVENRQRRRAVRRTLITLVVVAATFYFGIMIILAFK